jgi:hypothetical protein
MHVDLRLANFDHCVVVWMDVGTFTLGTQIKVITDGAFVAISANRTLSTAITFDTFVYSFWAGTSINGNFELYERMVGRVQLLLLAL